MKSNNIIRVQKNKDNPYVMINKQCIKDETLTWAAKGLHTYLLSLPDDWEIYVNELVKHTSAGRDHTYTVIRELIAHGYMQRFEYRHKGKVVNSYYVVYENPIEITNLTKKMATIIKVDIDSEGNYIYIDESIENTTSEPNTETTDSVKSDSMNTKLLNNNSTKKELKLNNDLDEDDAEKSHQEKIINLYKEFKLEKKVMPHTTKLLKEYSNYFSVDIFEYIFIQAKEDSVAKKYNYIKKLLNDYYENKIFNMSDLEKYNKEYSESKGKGNTNNKKPLTRFHNITDSTKKYTPDELEQLLKESQRDKFNNCDKNVSYEHQNKLENIKNKQQENKESVASRVFVPDPRWTRE